MAKKTFRNGMDSLLGVESTNEISKRQNDPTTIETIKSSKIGTKTNETRATFIVNEAQLEKIKAIAYWERLSIKEVLAIAIENFLLSDEKKMKLAMSAYLEKHKNSTLTK